MADTDLTGTLPGGPPRDVPVDWEALEDAFENNAPEVHSYLHVTSGEVLRVVDGIADPEMHARIASDATYMRIEPVSSREQYRWMERFIPMVEDKPLSELLIQAIDGKGAFRRFKDVLMTHGTERERWFAFRSERLRVFMEAWLAAHAMRPIARTVWPTEGAPRKDGAVAGKETETVAAARRVRSGDAQRRQLHELVETLSARDLDKVMAFAEFVKARRVARGFTRAEGSVDGEEGSVTEPQSGAGPDEGTDSDEETPPSQQRTATR